MRLLPVVAAAYLRRIHPIVPELASAAQAAEGEWEPKPVDERCFYEYPACSPTCVKTVTPRNGTIYHFLKNGYDKGCYLSLDSSCRLNKCFKAPHMFPQDLKRVECPITKCEFAAGLYRPKIQPLSWPAPNLTKKSLGAEGDEFPVPFHERYAAGRECRAAMWALRQTPERDALRKQCEGIDGEDECRETPRCTWRADAPRWFHTAARNQNPKQVPYLTTDDKVAPPPPETVKSLYDEDSGSGDASGDASGDPSADIADFLAELVDTWGVARPDGTNAVMLDSFPNLLNSLGIRIADNKELDHFWDLIDKDSNQNVDADELNSFVTEEGFEQKVLRKMENTGRKRVSEDAGASEAEGDLEVAQEAASEGIGTHANPSAA